MLNDIFCHRWQMRDIIIMTKEDDIELFWVHMIAIISQRSIYMIWGIKGNASALLITIVHLLVLFAL